MHARRTALAALLVVAVCSSVTAAFIYQYGQADHAAPADVIIVLGAGTHSDGSPTTGQIRRVAHAAALYQRGIAPWLLCTGGPTLNHPVDEAQTCVDLATSMGVPLSAILREDVSLNTLENVIESRRVMAARGLQRAVVVSDNFHLFRAEWLYRVYGMAVLISPAQATQGALPLADALFYSYREVGALVLNGLRLVVNPP